MQPAPQFEIRPVHDVGGYQHIVELQRRAWGMHESEVVPTHMLSAISRSGGQVLGAFDGKGQLAGFAVGLAAFNAKTGERYLRSEMVAVEPELQCKSLGYSIKQAQRREALACGMKTMCWLYDPLIAKNANLNIRKLGGRVYAFHPNEYGEMRSELYGSFPTDRFEVTWDLARTEPSDFPADVPQLVSLENGVPVLSTAVLASGAQGLICQIPLNHLELRKSARELALRWRNVFCELSSNLLDRNYCVAGFRLSVDGARGEYLFHKMS